MVKISNIVGVLTLLQLFYTTALYYGLVESSEKMPFNIYHEDTIFIMHLMTFFIVRAIERIQK